MAKYATGIRGKVNKSEAGSKRVSRRILNPGSFPNLIDLDSYKKLKIFSARGLRLLSIDRNALNQLGSICARGLKFSRGIPIA